MTLERHPDEERLAALAGADPDVLADAELRAHVSACQRCSAIADELTWLRAALAELPEIAPPATLRAWTPAAVAAVAGPQPSFAERLLGTLRRTVMPAAVAGATLALVGVVGATGVLEGGGAMGQAAGGAGAGGAGAGGAAAPMPAVGDGEESGVAENYVLASPAERTEADRDETSVGAGGDDSTTTRVAPPALGPPGGDARGAWWMVIGAGAALLLLAGAGRVYVRSRGGAR